MEIHRSRKASMFWWKNPKYDLTGRRFGKLKVLRVAPHIRSGWRSEEQSIVLSKRNADEERLYLYNKQQMYRRDDWHCRCCNRSSMLTPHHVVFQSQGGGDELSNLLCLCTPCHDDIHGGRLRVEVVEVIPGENIIVKFWKQKGWRPR